MKLVSAALAPIVLVTLDLCDTPDPCRMSTEQPETLITSDPEATGSLSAVKAIHGIPVAADGRLAGACVRVRATEVKMTRAYDGSLAPGGLTAHSASAGLRLSTLISVRQKIMWCERGQGRGSSQSA